MAWLTERLGDVTILGEVAPVETRVDEAAAAENVRAATPAPKPAKQPVAAAAPEPVAVAPPAVPVRRCTWFIDTTGDVFRRCGEAITDGQDLCPPHRERYGRTISTLVEAPQRTTAASESQLPRVEGATVIKVDFIKGRATTGSKLDDVPQAWREGCAHICSMPPPRGFTHKRGFTPEEWQSVGKAATEIVGRWGAEMARLGWSDFDLFAVDSVAPATRLDAMGLVPLMGPCQIIAIDERGADLMTPSGAVQRFPRRPLPTGATLLWHLLPEARAVGA